MHQQNGNAIRILGIDTALRKTGYGVLDTDGSSYTVCDCGLIRNRRTDPLSSCLHRLSGGISEILELYAPGEAALEGSFYSRNVKTAMLLGMGRGAVVSAVACAEIPIYEYAPRRVKQACIYAHVCALFRVCLQAGLWPLGLPACRRPG